MTLKYDHVIGIPFGGIGVRDCYSLVADMYRENFNMKLTNIARPNDWSSDQMNLIEDHCEMDGFEKLTSWKPKDLRPGDVLAMAILERNPNHLAVYVGDSKIVHHMYGQLSREDELRDFWFNSTCFILRHPDVPDLRPVYPDVDIMDLINARIATPTE